MIKNSVEPQLISFGKFSYLDPAPNIAAKEIVVSLLYKWQRHFFFWLIGIITFTLESKFFFLMHFIRFTNKKKGGHLHTPIIRALYTHSIILFNLRAVETSLTFIAITPFPVVFAKVVGSRAP